MGFIRTPEIRGFAGEDRFNPFPPPNVARDGLNNDYSRGTLRKRKGFVRLHPNQVKTGGVLIDNKATAGHLYAPHIDAYAFASKFSGSIKVKPIQAPDGGITIAGCYHAGTHTGWKVTLTKHTNGRFYFWFHMGNGSVTTSQRTATVNYVNMGQVYQLDFGLDADGSVFIAVDGTRYTDIVTGLVYANSNLDIVIGNDSPPASTTCSIIVDEFRLWDVALSQANMTALHGRELRDSEKTNLVAYWRFNDAASGVVSVADDSGNNNPLFFSPRDALSFTDSMVSANPNDYGAVVMNGMDTFLHAPYVSNWASCFTGYTWAVEGWVTLTGAHQSDATICTIGDDGNLVCGIRFDGLTNLIEVEFDRVTTGTTVHATTYTATVGKPFHITVSYFYRWLTVHIIDEDGEEVTTTDLGDIRAGVAIPGSPSAYYGITLGASAQAAGTLDLHAPVLLDDWRFYDTQLDYAYIVANYDRELSSLSHVLFYTHLDQDNYWVDVTGNSNMAQYDATAWKPKWSMGLVSNKTISPVLGLIPMKQAQGVDDILMLTASDAFSLQGNRAEHIGALTYASTNTRSHTYFRDTAIICDGENAPIKYDGDDAPRPLTPQEPVVSGITAVAGDGTGLTGVYKYKFQYIGRDGSVGPVSLSSVTTAALSNDDVDIAAIPASYDPQIVTVRIYRTKSGEDVFYRLADIAAPAPGATGTYTDNAADTTLTEEEDPYLGICPACRFTFTHQEKVFAGNYSGFESRLRYSETGYFERWYFDNYIDFGRGDGDVLTGGISIGHRALLSKRHSLWLLEGPPYAAIKFWDGSGCVSGNTLAVGEQGVYMLSASGVMVWDGQSLPVKVGGDSQNPIWETMNESRWPYAVGAYFPPTQEYWVTFDVEDGSRITMVWSERKQAWGKLDIPVDAYAPVSLSGGPMSLLAAVRGYCVELRRGDNDGVNVNDSDFEVTGAVVAGTDASFTVADPWSGSFLGLDVELLAPDGTAQRRTIWHQNSDEVLVTEPFDAIPDDTYTWELGPIDWYWESGPIHFGENLPDVAVRGADIIFRPTGTEVNCVLEHWGDGDPGAATVVTVT